MVYLNLSLSMCNCVSRCFLVYPSLSRAILAYIRLSQAISGYLWLSLGISGFSNNLDISTKFLLNPISHRGGPRPPPPPPPSGFGDCSKMHLYINLKLLDFSYISKTKILNKKKIRFFYPTPPQMGVLKNEDFENWSESLSCKT